MRIWKSLTNNQKEIEEYDKKYKNNFTSIKIDALLLNLNEKNNAEYIEDANIADDDILIVEV